MSFVKNPGVDPTQKETQETKKVIFSQTSIKTSFDRNKEEQKAFDIEEAINDLRGDFLVFFPFNLWMKPNGTNSKTGDDMFKMVFPREKSAYSKTERKIFEKRLKLLLHATEKDLQIQLSCTEKEDCPHKPFEESSASTDFSNDTLITRLQERVEKLKDVLVDVREPMYGIFRGRVIHPHRLWLVPHATLTVEAKDMQRELELKN